MLVCLLKKNTDIS